MNAISKDSGRLAWLMAVLGAKRQRLATLLERLRGIGMPGAMKPSLFRKFLNMLDQISVVKEQENQIIGRIEAIEAKHRFQRKHKALHYAEPKPRYQDFEFDEEPECERPFSGWLWILVLIAFMSGRKINQKKQSLTAD